MLSAGDMGSSCSSRIRARNCPDAPGGIVVRSTTITTTTSCLVQRFRPAAPHEDGRVLGTYRDQDSFDLGSGSRLRDRLGQVTLYTWRHLGIPSATETGTHQRLRWDPV